MAIVVLTQRALRPNQKESADTHRWLLHDAHPNAACTVILTQLRHFRAAYAICSALQQDFKSCKGFAGPGNAFFLAMSAAFRPQWIAGCWGPPIACSSAQTAFPAQPLPAMVTNTPPPGPLLVQVIFASHFRHFRMQCE